jgi:MFS family permease
MTELSADGGAPRKETPIHTVVIASAAGTAFEWYDFFLFVPMAAIMSRVFFSGLDPTAAYIFALGAFAVGFAFRPLGALIFGRVGDRLGRKATFLITMSLMGVATFLIGFLPTYAQVGIASPLMFIGLRILQGLALGGEWGGAAIYIVEHASKNKRGAASSWLGASAAFGLAGALIVVLITRAILGVEAFDAWGWRIPFLISAVLLGISIWIRLKLHESPVFAKLKEEGRRSERPYVESFFHWPNLKLVLLALFGIMIAQGAVWYTVFFYASTFLEQTVKVSPQTKDLVILIITAVSVPLYVFFGALSDRIGRKTVMLGGLVLMIVAYFPAFHMLQRFGNPALAEAQERAPVTVMADPADCSFQFDPIGQSQFRTGCDIAKSTLARAGVSYVSEDAPAGTPAVVRIGDFEVSSASAEGQDAAGLAATRADVQGRIMAALADAGYPERADPEETSIPGLLLVLLVLTCGATALYGPQAAALVEMFPARVRYTALSLPYHIGTGWVGGFLPATAFAIVAATGDIFAGLWYPFVFTLIAAIVMAIFLREPRGAALD